MPKRTVCVDCGAEFVQPPSGHRRRCPDCVEAFREETERRRLETAPSDYMRKCHDCGRPTTQYRCAECWAKFREKAGLVWDKRIREWVEKGREDEPWWR